MNDFISGYFSVSAGERTGASFISKGISLPSESGKTKVFLPFLDVLLSISFLKRLGSKAKTLAFFISKRNNCCWVVRP